MRTNNGHNHTRRPSQGDNGHQSRQDRIKSARTALDEHVKALAEQMRQGKSENLVAYLEFASHFHHYSVGNQLLIWAQRPNATFVAGIRRWNELGRFVRQGERGLLIFAPMRYRRDASRHRVENGNELIDVREEREVTTFRPVYVFDASQTQGEPLPTLNRASGDVGDLLPALRKVIHQRGIELIEAGEDGSHALPLGAEGVSSGGRIGVRADLPDPELFRVMAHELAHELLHHTGQPRPDRRIRETEADAAAFVVCRHFGVSCDCSDYLLLYDSSPDVLIARLEGIRQAAATIIDGIEALLESTAAASDEPAADQISTSGRADIVSHQA